MGFNLIYKKTKLIKGNGIMIMKGEDDNGEKLHTLSLVRDSKQIFMISFCKHGWYDGDKSNTLRFTIKDGILFLRTLAFVKVKNASDDID